MLCPQKGLEKIQQMGKFVIHREKIYWPRFQSLFKGRLTGRLVSIVIMEDIYNEKGHHADLQHREAWRSSAEKARG